MLIYKRVQILAGLLVAISLILAACSTPAAAPAAQRESLRFAVLRIIDSLPMYVAQQEGLFAKYNLDVEIIPVGSAPERDQLIAANRADGMISEVLTALFYNKDTTQVQIVRFARAATPETHLFSILASKKSGITSVEGLKGVPVGISDGTVIAYLTDRMLQKEGFAPEDIQTISVPSLGDRMALLGSGELAAATLPEPLTTLAVQQGAVVVLDDSQYPDLSHSTITFRKAYLDEKPEAVRGFLAAIEDAVKLINADPKKYEKTLIELQIVPAPLEGKFSVPQFVTAGVPSEAQFQDVVDWARSKGLVDKDYVYTDLINTSFLPKP